MNKTIYKTMLSHCLKRGKDTEKTRKSCKD